MTPPPLSALLGWAVVRVRGRSMQPVLRDGDLLLVRLRRERATAARPGLVVVRLPGGRGPAVKRLVRRTPEGWWVERDNPRSGTDSWQVGAIPEPDLIGRVILRLWPRPGRPGRP